MSWTNELYKVYELVVENGKDNDMLPISHIKTKANIEITIKENGELADSGISSVNGDPETIVPDTGKAKVGMYPPPYPLNESLRYIAGDLNDYISEKIKGNERNFNDYITQLADWKNSNYSHRAVNAIYNYVIKKTVIHDCLEIGVLKIDEKTNKLIDSQLGTTVDKLFVRFKISCTDGIVETWKDTSLYNVFNDYLASKSTEKELCYATGKMLPVTYTHPMGIVRNNARAKLISANDNTNYTYRGRFSSKEEAVAVSYDYSQKIHNALKWLISKQYITVTDKENNKTITYNPFSFDTLQLLVWNSALGFVPVVFESIHGQKIEKYDGTKKFPDMVDEALKHGKEIDPRHKVMIMGLDAATTGRLSIAIYSELLESDFYANLRKWHEETVWSRRKYNVKQDEMIYVDDSCSLIQIAKCLYGTEREQKGNLVLNCDNKLIGDTILRLLPCVTEGKKLPHDVVATLVLRASSPLSYEKEYNHRMILENACALIKKEQAEHENKLYYKGEIKMAYDPTCTDRSYLFGCLLAIADKAESDTYEKDEKRVTNARRLWNAFAQHPYQTWGVIESRLEPYLEKDQRIMEKYTKRINEIMDKMSHDDFNDNSKLTPMYLIGFHHYNSHLWNGNKADDNKEE